ncbi:MAG: ABC transporter substrate-binding protein [Planctomycetota bacterium]|nr:MAG: ABC transporter substrate-binding protein [Planctomycetota bacterium]
MASEQSNPVTSGESRRVPAANAAPTEAAPSTHSRRRRWTLRTAVSLAVCTVAWLTWRGFDHLLNDRSPIIVGILHSQTGPMAVSELSMIDAEVLALEEINAEGGLLGRKVEWVIADGASDPPKFAKQADRLISKDGACVIFGCWTSASRKGVLPVVEAADHLLVYPMAYEGLEQSPNIVYTGAAPNQQITPAVQWCHEKLKARRFFLIGSDYVWPHCVNAIISDQLAALGAEKVSETYMPFGSMDASAAVKAILETKPDVVLSSVVGDSALAFAQALRAAGVDPNSTPVLTFALGENELQTMPRGCMVGNYASWSYFQSIDRPENLQFVNGFKARYGRDRTVQDVMETAYFSVKLWAQAVREADTIEVRAVRYALRRQSLNAPEGTIAVDPQTQHTWRPVSIGRIRSDGQFDIVWRSRTAVRPVPFPSSRPREVWEKFVGDLYRGWGGQWIAPLPDPTRGNSTP